MPVEYVVPAGCPKVLVESVGRRRIITRVAVCGVQLVPAAAVVPVL